MKSQAFLKMVKAREIPYSVGLYYPLTRKREKYRISQGVIKVSSRFDMK
jgi:hypothetical protein